MLLHFKNLVHKYGWECSSQISSTWNSSGHLRKQSQVTVILVSSPLKLFLQANQAQLHQPLLIRVVLLRMLCRCSLGTLQHLRVGGFRKEFPFPWISLGFLGFPWTSLSLDFPGFPWISLGFPWFPRIFLGDPSAGRVQCRALPAEGAAPAGMRGGRSRPCPARCWHRPVRVHGHIHTLHTPPPGSCPGDVKHTTLKSQSISTKCGLWPCFLLARLREVIRVKNQELE